VPNTVQAVLAARIDQLPPREKQLLQLAAVIGSTVLVRLLKCVDGLDDDQRADSLAQLQRAEFLYSQWSDNEDVVVFKHALTREVAYQSLLDRTRTGFHRRIADVLEQGFGAIVEERPELLARHLMESGDAERAIAQWRLAGERAQFVQPLQRPVTSIRDGLEELFSDHADGLRRPVQLETGRLELGRRYGAQSGPFLHHAHTCLLSRAGLRNVNTKGPQPTRTR